MSPTQKTLRINEVFYSIQGESTRAGRPCVFIRLTGCDLRCVWCDTEYAFNEGQQVPIADLVDQALAYPTHLIEITGGEPLLQPAVHNLMSQLCDAARTVLIETSGSRDISTCDPRVIRILDLKPPGSGMCQRNDMSNIAHLTHHDEVKFVITDRADFDWAARTIEAHSLVERTNAVLLSPAFHQPPGQQIPGHQGLEPALLAEWILESGLPVIFQPQIHKQIWSPQTRGV